MSDATRSVRAQVALPTPTAVWVLGAHAFTLATPVVLAAVAWSRHDALRAVLARPGWLIPAAMLLLLGSVAEAAQNTEERWIYRGPTPAFNDAVFVVCITAGMATLAAAAAASLWVLAAAILSVVLAVVLYRRGNPGFAAMGTAGALGAVCLFVATGQPVALLVLVTNGLGNALLLDLVVRTGAQSLHGAIAAANGLGTLCLAAALAGAGTAATPTRAAVAAIAAVMLLGAFGLRPRLVRLRPTPTR